MEKDRLEQLIDYFEEEVKNGGHSMLGCFQVGLVLKVLGDRLWMIDNYQAQRCDDLCHYILEQNKG